MVEVSDSRLQHCSFYIYGLTFYKKQIVRQAVWQNLVDHSPEPDAAVGDQKTHQRRAPAVLQLQEKSRNTYILSSSGPSTHSLTQFEFQENKSKIYWNQVKIVKLELCPISKKNLSFRESKFKNMVKI